MGIFCRFSPILAFEENNKREFCQRFTNQSYLRIDLQILCERKKTYLFRLPPTGLNSLSGFDAHHGSKKPAAVLQVGGMRDMYRSQHKLAVVSNPSKSNMHERKHRQVVKLRKKMKTTKQEL